MLKDIWKDKINGESIVDAADINEIAHSVIVLENKADSNKLAQDVEGDSIEKAVSQKAVKDALEEKPDKITKTWQAYTTDGNGNTVPKPLAAKPADGGVVLYNEGGILKTNAPVEDNDATNKKFVEGIAAGKVSKTSTKAGKNIPWYDPSSGEEGAYMPAFYALGETIPLRLHGGEVRVGTPKIDDDAANKKFVEDTVAPMQRDIRALNDAALGKLYTFEIFTFTAQFNDLPSGVLAHAYVRHIGPFRLYLVRNDGEKDFVGTANTCTVIFRDVDGIKISEFAPTMGEYFEIPEGAKSMYFEPVYISYNEGYSNYDNVEADFVVEMQVKVGG